MGKFVDLTGRRYGRLVVIERSGLAPSGHALWHCMCDCGRYHIVSSNQLRSGTKSCGCLRRERASETNSVAKRNERKKREPVGSEYRRLAQVYNDMKKRCYNPNNKRYSVYGGRGIEVCSEWRNSFTAFKEWALKSGYSDELTLDRKNVDGNYSPDNCRWATRKEQNNNRRNNRIVEYNGASMTLHELSELCGIEYKTLWSRFKAGWSVIDAVQTPVRRRVNGHYVV